MDFSDTPQEAAFREKARKFVAENAPRYLEPYLKRSNHATLDVGPHDLVAECKKWQKTKARGGFGRVSWPKAYGGADATQMEQVIWEQEEGLYSYLTQIFIVGFGMCGPTLLAYATEDQKKRLLPKLVSGEEVWCQFFSEPGAGSDLAGLKTRAERDGDDWIVNGHKVWTSYAHLADYGILITRTDPTVAKHKGLTMFFVSTKSPGVEVRPIKQGSGQSDFNEVFFTDVCVPDHQRLGAVGDGWNVSLTTLMNERLAVGGGTMTLFEEVFALARQLKTSQGPASDDRAVRARLAEWYARASGLKYTTARLMTKVSRGEIPGPEASIGKLVMASTTQEMAEFALDLQGFSGILTAPDKAAMDGHFQKTLLRSPGMRVEGGTDEIMRNIIAERVLGLPPDIRVDKTVPFNQIPTGAIKGS